MLQLNWKLGVTGSDITGTIKKRFKFWKTGEKFNRQKIQLFYLCIGNSTCYIFEVTGTYDIEAIKYTMFANKW